MKRRKHTGVWLMLAPLYIFTLLFVAGPLIYMVVLSFQQRAEVWGVVHTFTLENYKNIRRLQSRSSWRSPARRSSHSSATRSAILWQSSPPHGRKG